jgi:hypothetical protein
MKFERLALAHHLTIDGPEAFQKSIGAAYHDPAAGIIMLAEKRNQRFRRLLCMEHAPADLTMRRADVVQIPGLDQIV